LTDFDEIWQHGAHWPVAMNRPLKFRIFENQDGSARHLKSHKNRDISATVLSIFTKFGAVVQMGFVHRPDP